MMPTNIGDERSPSYGTKSIFQVTTYLLTYFMVVVVVIIFPSLTVAS